MQRYLIVAALILSSAGIASGQPNKAGGHKNNPSQQRESTAPTTYTYQSNCCTTQAPANSKEEPSRWYTPLERPEWWLVIFGFPTLFIVSWQAILMRQHASHFKDLAEKTATAAAAAEISNTQSAEFFRTEKRPWIGVVGNISMRDKKSTKPGCFGFTLEYVIKNFGVTPAFNTVVPFGIVVEGTDIHNYALVKNKVDEARRTGENIVSMTGDLLLPGAEKAGSCEFPETQRNQKFVITGCIVYRFADGSTHHTELSYWIDLSEGDKAKFRTLWFQAAD